LKVFSGFSKLSRYVLNGIYKYNIDFKNENYIYEYK
jgi:hypothetical protein